MGAACWMLFMHYVDMYYLVVPNNLASHGFHPSIVDLLSFIGVGGIFAAVLGWRLMGAPAVPVKDPQNARIARLREFLDPAMSLLEKRLLKDVARASIDFQLIEPDDHIMVCLSGGKDSYAMLSLLLALQRRAPFSFQLTAVNLDQHQPGFEQNVIASHCDSLGVAHKMLSKDTYSIVLDKTPEGKTYCSLCSRLRRGILYNAAEELGATKIALGHHKDDLIETLLLNLFFSGQLKSMPPRLHSDDGRNIVIRPLAYCSETEIQAYSDELNFPILPCNLCGSQDNLQRKKMKKMVHELEEQHPGIRASLFAAMGNLRLSHLLDAELAAQARVNHPLTDV